MADNIYKTINKIECDKTLSDDEFLYLLNNSDADNMLFETADKVRKKIYSNEVYIRGLIEFTNHCKNNCNYCGIRRGNSNAVRYRLSKEDILSCCREGYSLGFRTFVLQGGEDAYFTDKILCDIVAEIRKEFADCAITLSVGERSRESYKNLKEAGANRYLLRHETANCEHYAKLHPTEMSSKKRKQCLYDLKELGYQVGSGFMVGSPYQTLENIVEDLRFLEELKPDMIGIGPFITHNETPFKDFENGTCELTLKLISILRLMFPHALIPSTTALGTIHSSGRELGLKAGANVVMPNLSPTNVRKKYELYENKICTGEEAAQCRDCLEKRVEAAGYKIVTDIGNVKY